MRSIFGLIKFLKEGRVGQGAYLGRYVIGGTVGPGERCHLGRTKVDVGGAVGGRHSGICMFLMMGWVIWLERMV